MGYAASSATTPQPAIKTSTPRSEKDVTNIDVLRQQLRNYYGDPLGTGQFGADSNYAREASGVAADGAHYLSHYRSPSHKTKAIVLDVDDTTLATWNYEIVSNWAYNPATNADYVTGQLFPAVPGMVALANAAEREGYAIFYLTGRPTAQEAATLGNLTADGIGVDAGYPQADHPPRRRGRPVHQARRDRLPGLPEDGLRRRPERQVHDDPLQVGHPRPPASTPPSSTRPSPPYAP